MRRSLKSLQPDYKSLGPNGVNSREYKTFVVFTANFSYPSVVSVAKKSKPIG